MAEEREPWRDRRDFNARGEGKGPGGKRQPPRSSQSKPQPPAARHKGPGPNAGKPKPGRSAPKTSLKLRRAASGAWELVHPPCVMERADDLAEVHTMLGAGEIDIAREELLWLLEGCRDFVEAHKLLAELAVAEGDTALARAHFGFAYQIGAAAIPTTGLDAPLAYDLPSNQPFLEAAKGLAWALREMQHGDQARAILEQLLTLDPSDPLGARLMLSEPDNPAG